MATNFPSHRIIRAGDWVIASVLFLILGQLIRLHDWQVYIASRPQTSPPPVKVPLQEMLNNPEWDPGKAVIPPVVRK